jgi:hypothetical protein
MTRLMPGTPAPALDVHTAAGPWSLAAQTPASFTLIAFYRGYHCPVCKGFLGELNRLIPDSAAVGTNVIAVSMEGADRAAKAVAEWGLDALTGMVEARREEVIAHFFREGEINLGSRPVFRPKVGGKWEHEYNAVTDIVVREVNDPDVDEDVASQWKRVEEMLSLGLGPDELTD